jgi:hypothetical protein
VFLTCTYFSSCSDNFFRCFFFRGFSNRCFFFPRGVHLSDYSLTDEVNPGKISSHINLGKFELLAGVLEHLLGHHKFLVQSVSDHFLKEIQPLSTLLRALPALTENELYELSLEREPRGCDIKDLM